MGFESSQVAQRRLATMARDNTQLREALDAPDAGAPSDVEVRSPIAFHLEALAQAILETPGAGSALLSAYAEQARALRLVLEAARRSDGGPLPAAVLQAARAALVVPPAIADFA